MPFLCFANFFLLLFCRPATPSRNSLVLHLGPPTQAFVSYHNSLRSACCKSKCIPLSNGFHASRKISSPCLFKNSAWSLMFFLAWCVSDRCLANWDSRGCAMCALYCHTSANLLQENTYPLLTYRKWRQEGSASHFTACDCGTEAPERCKNVPKAERIQDLLRLNSTGNKQDNQGAQTSWTFGKGQMHRSPSPETCPIVTSSAGTWQFQSGA